jgi:hypothetical protein
VRIHHPLKRLTGICVCDVEMYSRSRCLSFAESGTCGGGAGVATPCSPAYIANCQAEIDGAMSGPCGLAFGSALSTSSGNFYLMGATIFGGNKIQYQWNPQVGELDDGGTPGYWSVVADGVPANNCQVPFPCNPASKSAWNVNVGMCFGPACGVHGLVEAGQKYIDPWFNPLADFTNCMISKAPGNAGWAAAGASVITYLFAPEVEGAEVLVTAGKAAAGGVAAAAKNCSQ